MFRLRSWLLRCADRLAPARLAMARVLAAAYARRGADRYLLDEATAHAGEREAKRTAEMIMWAGAVAGVARFPQWFPAAHHIRDAGARARSAEALRDHLTRHPDESAHLWRQYFALLQCPVLDEVRAFADRDLRRQLTHISTSAEPGRVTATSEQQLEILARATTALAPTGVHPFLVSGTLLGCVRDGQLMEHDYDIDLGVLPGDGTANTIAEALETVGFEVTTQELKVVARDESGFAVDVFLHYERDDLIWHGTDIHEWWNTRFGLVRSELQGVEVWVPDDAQRYLDENYGEWQQPVAFYNFSFDTPNRCYRQTPQALLYLHKRLANAIAIGDRWTVESAARELRDAFGVDVTDTLAPSPLIDPSRRDELV